MIYSFQYSAASASIANRIPEARYVLLFAFNSFVALGIASIIQNITAAMKYSTDQIFVVLAWEMGALAVGALLVTLLEIGHWCLSHRQRTLLGTESSTTTLLTDGLSS
jgi:hypothetical protein